MVDESAPSFQEARAKPKAADSAEQDGKLVRLIDHFKREWQLYVMLAPTIIWFIVFLYKPM